MAADSTSLALCFLFTWRRKGRGDVTSSLREKHAWSICFDCVVLQRFLKKKICQGACLIANSDAGVMGKPRVDISGLYKLYFIFRRIGSNKDKLLKYSYFKYIFKKKFYGKK